jgi:hypothetical protein
MAPDLCDLMGACELCNGALGRPADVWPNIRQHPRDISCAAVRLSGVRLDDEKTAGRGPPARLA